MSSRRHRDIGFFDAFQGLLFEPSATVPILIDREDPPYTISFFVLLLLSAFGPLGIHYYLNSGRIGDYTLFLAFLCTIGFAMTAFAVLESIVLLIFGIPFNISQIVALVCYSLAPLVLIEILMLLFDYFSNNELTVMTLLLTGRASMGGLFVKILPFVLIIAQMNIFLVFLYAVQALGRLPTIGALALTLLSLLPFYASFVMSIYVCDLLVPGVYEIFLQFSPSLEHFQP